MSAKSRVARSGQQARPRCPRGTGNHLSRTSRRIRTGSRSSRRIGKGSYLAIPANAGS